MKDFKSFLIGFLMCACMFLFMGQSFPTEDVGTYQAYVKDGKEYMLDTTNGDVYFRKWMKKNQYTRWIRQQ
tara:strand:+ start:205 stop:417 length:213 start_codon:yes stop_codon:yes gene_type:complete